MWNKTKITELFRIQYPIIQGPFGGSYSSAKLVAEVSNSGGLGSFGLNSYNPEEIMNIDAAIKSLTNKPYALNLWVPFQQEAINQYTQNDFEKLKDLFRPDFDALGLSLPNFPAVKIQHFDDQVEAILKAKPPIVSFIFGVPAKEVIQALKAQNIQLIGTATTLEEAKCIEAAGFDAVVASGMEAGGHRASFLSKPEDALLPTALLVERLRINIQCPMIAAGGISRGKDIVKLLQSGAEAVQMGTAFLATDASNASKLHKELLLSKTMLKTSLTDVFTGRLARAIDNQWSKKFVDKKEIAPYPIQSLFLSTLRKKAVEKKQLGYIPFWAGQPSTILRHTTVKKLFEALIEEANKQVK